MFWRFGGYANISTIDTILDKPDVSLEEVLEESDLIQELKQHNSKLIEYLRDENVLQRLLDYVVAPPPIGDEDEDWEDEGEEEHQPERKSMSPLRSLSMGRSKENKSARQEEREERENKEKTRQKYAYVASEVLSSETWSIIEALMENQQYLKKFWEFIRREAPLDPVTAGYFTKINETLLDKKTEETLDFVKSLDAVVPAMLQHVDCPMVMDLLLKIISMEKAEGGQGIVDWLQAQSLMPKLLAYLGEEYPTFTQTSAGDFIKAIITISANASQNEQSCIGPNSLTRQLVSEQCIESMIADMLKGGNPLTVGVGIIIEVIRKNNSDYDPEITMGNELPPSTSDPIYLGTLLRLFAKHVPDFTSLILSPNHTVSKGEDTVTEKRKDLQVAFGNSIEPLGFDRFKTCELMAELLHCSNMGLLNERGSEDYISQRDKERERLKAAGVLAKPKEPQSAITEFSEDGSSFNAGEGSPKETRKLEVTNSAEDDGFEDVGPSADINEEIKEGQPIKRSASRVSLEDEFVDEPLTSPKQDQPPKSPTAERNLDPQSPATALASDVQDIHIGGDGQSPSSEAPHDSSKSAADDLVDEIEAQLSPDATATTADAPALPKRNSLTASNGTEPAGAVSPNEEDKPAPLFASRTEEQPQPEAQSADPQAANPEVDPQNPGQEMPFIHRLETDVDGKPIVGDYLKMQFVEHKVVPTILDFFFRFPWNNFLHNVVYDVVQQVFNGPMDRGYNRNLAFDLFQTGRITERIIEGQLRSDEVTAQNNMRLGYMGHLTLVAEEVVKFTERHPPEMLSETVMEYLSSKIWTDYVDNTLSETRDRDNAILGGVRPDMAVGPRQAVLNAVNAATGFGNTGSNALVNAGLNGGTGLDSMDLSNNGQSNFLSGGSLLSGFGSSSDEEDEEMEEIGEQEEGSGESSSDQYPTYTPTSLSALSAFSADSTSPTSPQPPDPSTTSPTAPSPPTNPPPSIPPPLNIPPSRARRQLQARLALSKEKAEREARTSSADSPTSGDSAGDGSGHANVGGEGKIDSTGADMSAREITGTDPVSEAEGLDRLLRANRGLGGVGGVGADEAVSEALRWVDERGRGLGAGFEPAGAAGAAGGAAGVAGQGGAATGLGVGGNMGMGEGVGGWDGSSDESSDEDVEGTPGSGDGEGDGKEGDEGEDVPIRMSSSPRTMAPGVMGRMKALFASGQRGSDDGMEGEGDSSDEAEAEEKGKAKGGEGGEEVKRASVRRAIDDE